MTQQLNRGADQKTNSSAFLWLGRKYNVTRREEKAKRAVWRVVTGGCFSRRRVGKVRGRKGMESKAKRQWRTNITYCYRNLFKAGCLKTRSLKINYLLCWYTFITQNNVFHNDITICTYVSCTLVIFTLLCYALLCSPDHLSSVQFPFYVVAWTWVHIHAHRHTTFHTVFLIWLISLNMIISSFAHFSANDLIHFSLWLYKSSLCLYSFCVFICCQTSKADYVTSLLWTMPQ